MSIGIGLSEEKLQEILNNHALWLKNKNEGQRADFGPYILSKKDLSGLDLSEANFYNTALLNANFENTILRGANFKGAKAEKAKFSNCDLSNADFSLADLEEANFENANIENTVFIGAILKNTNFNNNKNESKADFRNTIKEEKSLSSQIEFAKKSLSEALKNTDERISDNKAESKKLIETARKIFYIDIIFLILIPLIILNPLDIHCLYYFQAKFISFKALLGNWGIIFYTLPSVTMLIIATTLLRHDQKLIKEIRYFSEMKHEIELFSGLLEASQHAANSFNNHKKAAKYVEDTFTLIRNKLLKVEKVSHDESTENTERDENKNLDIFNKIIDLLSKLTKN